MNPATPPPHTDREHECRPALQPQFRNGEWTFLLDGRVVEWFSTVSEGTRLHVDQLRIDAFPDRDGLRIRWGVEVGGEIINGGRMNIPLANVAAFEEFIALAIANRSDTRTGPAEPSTARQARPRTPPSNPTT
jgi:hypothetical protein